jgi:catechol 2,3-dioxygenase
VRPAQAAAHHGLYHFAILLPGRRDLAQVLRRLAERGYPLQGAADHGVSEALYLADPDGNGIEIYADRPRDKWPGQDGQLQMVTDPLDVESLLGQDDGS